MNEKNHHHHLDSKSLDVGNQVVLDLRRDEHQRKYLARPYSVTLCGMDVCACACAQQL